MILDRSSPDFRPTPEQLAAFADGELDVCTRRQIEGWLPQHPEASAEIEFLHRLKRVWQDHAPPEPTATAWATTLERIEAGLPAPAPPRWQPRRRHFWSGLGVMTLAASLGLVLLARPLWMPPPVQDDGEEPYPVATAQDITIISMDARDTEHLVVGSPPVMEAMVLATQADITLVDMKPPRPEGPMPWLDKGPVPMILIDPQHQAEEGKQP
jgi:hypothetical protein